MKRGVNRTAREIALSSLKKGKREDALLNLFLYISLASSLIFFIFLSVSFIQMNGYATSISSKAGYITELDVISKRQVYLWAGVYGVALPVQDYNESFYEDIDNGEIVRVNPLFDCIKSDAAGGPEIFASLTPSLDFSNVLAGTAEMVDQFTNCNGDVFCANNTFTSRMNISLGSSVISDVPSVYTYRYDGQNRVFDVGILNVSGELVFVSHINASIQRGYSSAVLANFQMLLPTPANTTQRYYFHVDPNDACAPSGGIGFSINASVYGYAFDETNNLLSNVTVIVAGYSTITDLNGFYNLSFIVVPGNYNFLAQKTGYDSYLSNVTVNSSNYIIHKNFSMNNETPFVGKSILVHVYGYVTDDLKIVLNEARVYFGNSSYLTNLSGYYSIYSYVPEGLNPIISIKEGYNNNITFLNINSSTTEINQNLTLILARDNPYLTGPYTTTDTGTDVGPGLVDEVREEVQKNGEDYWISSKEIRKQVRINTFVEEKVAIFNFRNADMRLTFSLSPDISDIVKLNYPTLTVRPQNGQELTLTIYGTRPIGVYTGTLNISGDLQQTIPITIEVTDKKNPFETLLMKIELVNKIVSQGNDLKYKLTLQNLLVPQQSYKVYLKHKILNLNRSEVYTQFEDEAEIENSLTILENIKIPANMNDGNYLLEIEAKYLNMYSTISVPFVLAKPIYLYAFLGIPLWLYFVIISLVSFVIFNFFVYKKHLDKKKRYHLEIDTNSLPQKGTRSIKLGKLAETNIPSYYDLDMLTTHAIIAGATGGGKSISAQVLIEEALMKNIAVIVFDPTAQWSGMLRKCDDKRMLSFYPKFGLKPSDARAFPGSVRQVKNARQAINIKKLINPGQIQIFTLNKLDPSEMDVFVAGVIASIFRSGPEEYPGLRVMLVFDEVHRLLPKFGGSGKGFLQIERACREFRKWGFGVMLVSQVLSDFVGEIKANINTEMQMRVAEENDLQRIKERYGEDALRSLVRADVGTGMVQNAEYNRGRPFFVAFRPILHNTRRLSDEILDKYNNYNDMIDDIEYQIEQLEQFKVDVFDLKMELKLVKDKLMTGNFSVVDIYLEGLKPRLEKQWQKIGKKPKKKEIELVDISAIESSLAEAKKGRSEWEKKDKKEEKKEEKSEENQNNDSKIVKPLIFDNGLMVSSLKELKETLPTLDNEVFAVHVNEEKNQIAEWVEKNINKVLGVSLRKIRDKSQIVSILSEFGKDNGKNEEKEKK